VVVAAAAESEVPDLLDHRKQKGGRHPGQQHAVQRRQGLARDPGDSRGDDEQVMVFDRSGACNRRLGGSSYNETSGENFTLGIRFGGGSRPFADITYRRSASANLLNSLNRGVMQHPALQASCT